ncbi:CU044_5270 family protein [Streptosporangium sp. NBC_01639]|uniref:CU044_5270 family protein n=1 Tax=Streptosporangium sp. NBC_01639 TaxID=2975948 RepID=UPI00386D88F8|nr:CU044_5270 family protein [Streptosporangium sp. NBC_01639]
MDELREIGTLLAKPEPPREAVDRGRRRLQGTMRGRTPSRRRPGWLAGGLAVAATTAAVIVVVTGSMSPTAPAPSAQSTQPTQSPASALSAAHVLLVAATTAENLPEPSGAYWHVTEVYKDDSGQVIADKQAEYWFRRDGRSWAKLPSLSRKETILRFTGLRPFRLGPLEMSYEELRRLPADPDALVERLRTGIADAVDSGDIRTSAGRPSDGDQDDYVFYALTSLISQAPVEPDLRAAAFRAIASLPNVRSLGETDGGGQRLQVTLSSSQVELVVDPEAAQLRDTSFYIPWSGGLTHATKGTVTMQTEWTDKRPR